MSAEIINLAKARKAKAKAEKTTKAEQNRAKFGASKAQKSIVKSVQDKAVRLLDQSKREKPPKDPEE